MHKFLLHRVLTIIPTLLFVIFVVFFICNIAPSDPARIILGRQAPQEAIDALNEKLGVHDPVMVKYVNYLKNIAKGDFGKSYLTQKPVLTTIVEKIPETFKIAVIGTILIGIIGIPLGIISAIKQYSLLDTTFVVSSLTIASVPGFWLSIMLILVFSLKLGWFPTSGIGSWKHYVLPLFALALPTSAGVLRMTRATMLEVMIQDYIKTAKAKGAKKGRIIVKHALRNALIPAVTMLGLVFADLMSGALIVEMIFGLPGIGQTLVNAMRSNDIPMIMAGTILLASLFMLVILTLDIIYMFIDPRIKKQYI